MIEALLLAATQVATFDGTRLLTKASAFFFQRAERLFLVTSRHVLLDPAIQHHPDRIEIELHTDAVNLTRSVAFSVPLYGAGKSLWRQGRDSGGEVDVAAIELDRTRLPPTAVWRAFTPAHLQSELAEVDIGTPLLIVGFPLSFHDTLHHLPVVRQAVVASSFGVRFQGQGAFLTDARTHRGTSGAPVVMRVPAGSPGPLGDMPWKLLGVHSSRLDMRTRDQQVDESLGLNSAWYADILLTLTDPSSAVPPSAPATAPR